MKKEVKTKIIIWILIIALILIAGIVLVNILDKPKNTDVVSFDSSFGVGGVVQSPISDGNDVISLDSESYTTRNDLIVD